MLPIPSITPINKSSNSSSRTSKSLKTLIKKSMQLSMDESNLVSYQDIKDKLQPFDLIGFRGGDIISDLISTLEKYEIGVGAFSHVGMIVTSDILPKCHIDGKEFYLTPNHPYILESTFSYCINGISDGPADVVTGKGHLGVQLRDFEQVIPRYITDETTKVAWCQLLNNPFNRINNESIETLTLRRETLKNKFTEFFEEYEGRLYEIDLEGLLAAMFPSLRFIRNIRDKLFTTLFNVLHKCGIAKQDVGPAGWQFCSELVTNVYQMINIIPSSFDSRNVLPVDFFGYDKDGLPPLVAPPFYIKDWDIPGLPGFHYSEEDSHSD